MNNVIISTHGLKKYYFVGESTVKALDGVDMTVNKGESVCIAGRKRHERARTERNARSHSRTHGGAEEEHSNHSDPL